MAWGCAHTKIDEFDYAITLSTTPGMNGWTIADTSSSGTPTYLGTTEDGGSVTLTLVNTNEAEIVTLYQNDVLMYDPDDVSNFWWVAKVSGIDSTTTLVMGMATEQNDTADSVAEHVWFRMEGATSTTALVVETDDATTDNNDVATGTTLSSTYKRLLVDLSQGLTDVRFYVDGARVASGTTFSINSIASGHNMQPFVQLQKSGGTGTPAVQLAQWGITYKTSYGS